MRRTEKPGPKDSGHARERIQDTYLLTLFSRATAIGDRDFHEARVASGKLNNQFRVKSKALAPKRYRLAQGRSKSLVTGLHV